MVSLSKLQLMFVPAIVPLALSAAGLDPAWLQVAAEGVDWESVS